jgi:hypothetical protein
MKCRRKNFLPIVAVAFTLAAAGAVPGLAADETTVTASADGTDQDAATKSAAAIALTQAFQSLLPAAALAPMKERIADFVATDTAHLNPDGPAYDFGAIRQIEIVQAATNGEAVRVTARFTLSVDYLKDRAARQQRHASRRNLGLPDCRPLRAAGHTGPRHLGEDAVGTCCALYDAACASLMPAIKPLSAAVSNGLRKIFRSAGTACAASL